MTELIPAPTRHTSVWIVEGKLDHVTWNFLRWIFPRWRSISHGLVFDCAVVVTSWRRERREDFLSLVFFFLIHENVSHFFLFINIFVFPLPKFWSLNVYNWIWSFISSYAVGSAMQEDFGFLNVNNCYSEKATISTPHPTELIDLESTNSSTFNKSSLQPAKVKLEDSPDVNKWPFNYGINFL